MAARPITHVASHNVLRVKGILGAKNKFRGVGAAAFQASVTTCLLYIAI